MRLFLADTSFEKGKRIYELSEKFRKDFNVPFDLTDWKLPIDSAFTSELDDSAKCLSLHELRLILNNRNTPLVWSAVYPLSLNTAEKQYFGVFNLGEPFISGRLKSLSVSVINSDSLNELSIGLHNVGVLDGGSVTSTVTEVTVPVDKRFFNHSFENPILLSYATNTNTMDNYCFSVFCNSETSSWGYINVCASVIPQLEPIIE